MRLTGSILRLVMKERYKSPTLELIVPAIIVGNVFIPAYLERGGFKPYGLALAFVPLINISETATFALALRNVVFVTIEHIYQGYLATFLTMPISRGRFFLYVYLADVVVPLVIFWTVEVLYLYSSSLLNPYTVSLLVIFTVGYLFSSSLLLLISLMLKSPGASVLSAVFSLGAIFIGGGMAEYYLIESGRLRVVPFVSWMNPYVAAIAETVLGGAKAHELAVSLTVGVLTDLTLAMVLLLSSYLIFVREDL